MAGLHAVAGRQALLQQGRELLGELLPVLVADLVLKAVQDLKVSWGGGGGDKA